MKLASNPMLAVTMIHDRSGRLIGSYLVDRSKDAPNRDKRRQDPRKGASDQEEAVVFHHSERSSGTKGN